MLYNIRGINSKIIQVLGLFSTRKLCEEISEYKNILQYTDDIPYEIVLVTRNYLDKLISIYKIFENNSFLSDYIHRTGYIIEQFIKNETLIKYPEIGNNIKHFKQEDIITELEREYLTKLTLYDNELTLLGISYPKLDSLNKLCDCEVPKRLVLDNGIYCEECGIEIESYLYNIMTFKDSERVKMNSTLRYKRIGYFKNIIRQFQGKIDREIEEDVIITVKKSIIALGTAKITPTVVRCAMASLSLSKYYKYYMYFWSKITGELCPDLSDIEYILEEDFNSFDMLYVEKFQDISERSSAISYPYIVYQLLNKNGIFLPIDYFIMVTTERLEPFDNIVGSMFKELGWSNFKPIIGSITKK